MRRERPPLLRSAQNSEICHVPATLARLGSTDNTWSKQRSFDYSHPSAMRRCKRYH